MKAVACPKCGSTWVNALVRTYHMYEVRGISQPRGHSSRVVILSGPSEEIESGLDGDFKCREPNCGEEFAVPDDVRMFRRYKSAPLEDCNI